MSNHQRRSQPPPLPPSPLLSEWTSERPGLRVSASWITAPRTGETLNGDAVLVRETGSGVLLATIDALGHGPKAANVAQITCDYLTRADSVSVQELMLGLHETLRGTRGAAALLLHLTNDGMVACSVGNVELRSNDAKLPFVLTPGVLGVRLRQPKICSAGPGPHRFVLFTDGISSRFELKSLIGRPRDELVRHVFTAHRHGHDDATIVVVDVE